MSEVARARPAPESAWPQHAVAWRTLTPSARGAWIGLLEVHARVVKELDAELQSAHGLALAEFDVLRALSSAPDHEMRMSHLAEAVLFSRSGLTRLVGRLEERGLVERHRPERDVRQVCARLTDPGLAMLIAAEPTHVAGIRRRFVDRLDEQQLDQLAAAWARLGER